MEEPQKLLVEVVFPKHINPGNDKHLNELGRKTLKPKGVTFVEGYVDKEGKEVLPQIIL